MKAQRLGDDVGDACKLKLRLLRKAARLFQTLAVADQVNQVRDGLKRVIDLMSDGTGQLAHRCKFFRAAKRLLRKAGLGDVAESDDGAPGGAVLQDRLRGKLGVKHRAVLPEQVLDVIGERVTLTKDVVDDALCAWIGPAVGVMVMDGVVHIAADQLFGAVSKRGTRSTVDKGAAAFEVHAPDTLAGGVEQGLPGLIRRLTLQGRSNTGWTIVHPLMVAQPGLRSAQDHRYEDRRPGDLKTDA